MSDLNETHDPALKSWVASANDPHGDRATTFALRSIADPLAFLEFDQVFTPRLHESERFRDAFTDATKALAAHGSIGAIERLLGGVT